MKHILLGILILIPVLSFSQTINIDFGNQFVRESVLWNDSSKGYRNFMYIGGSFRTKTGINVGVNYTFQLKTVTLIYQVFQ